MWITSYHFWISDYNKATALHSYNGNIPVKDLEFEIPLNGLIYSCSEPNEKQDDSKSIQNLQCNIINYKDQKSGVSNNRQDKIAITYLKQLCILILVKEEITFIIINKRDFFVLHFLGAINLKTFLTNKIFLCIFKIYWNLLKAK